MSLKADPKRLQEYRRQMLRSAFVSLFWSIIQHKREKSKLKLQEIAHRLGKDKSVVSRWFSPDPPNWTLDTVSDIAGALDVELRIEAIERSTGVVFSPSGPRYQINIGERTEMTTADPRDRQPPRLVVNNSGLRGPPETAAA